MTHLATLSEFNLFLELPDDSEVMAQLVLAVPDTWAWVTGILKMRKLIADADMLSGSSGFELGARDKVTIVGGYDGKGRRSDPDIVRIVSTPALPDFVSFSYAGLYAHGSIAYAKQIAAALLRQRYLGGMYFYRDAHHDHESANSAKASFCFTSNRIMHGETRADPEMRKPYLHLEWFPHNGGKEAHIASIAEACRSLGLHEYGPGPIQFVTH